MLFFKWKAVKFFPLKHDKSLAPKASRRKVLQGKYRVFSDSGLDFIRTFYPEKSPGPREYCGFKSCFFTSRLFPALDALHPENSVLCFFSTEKGRKFLLSRFQTFFGFKPDWRFREGAVYSFAANTGFCFAHFVACFSATWLCQHFTDLPVFNGCFISTGSFLASANPESLRQINRTKF
jgi:hypothetical protein